MKIQNIFKSGTANFKNLETAISYKNNCIKSRHIVLDDKKVFWIVTPAEAGFLKLNNLEVIC